MTNAKNVAIIALSAALAYDSAVAIINKKRQDRNSLLYKKQKETIKILKLKIIYLTQKLDDMDAPCDAFDNIVMHFH
jgi:hypothetical protein